MSIRLVWGGDIKIIYRVLICFGFLCALFVDCFKFFFYLLIGSLQFWREDV